AHASNLPGPEGGPTAPAERSSPFTTPSSSRGRPFPNHCSGQVGAPQPDSHRRSHHSTSVRSGSQLSSSQRRTSPRTRSSVSTATGCSLSSSSVEDVEHLLGGPTDDGTLCPD